MPRSPILAGVPVVHIAPHLIFRIAVTFLNFTLQLVALAIDDVEVVVRQLSPLSSFILPFACFQFPSTRFQSMNFLLLNLT